MKKSEDKLTLPQKESSKRSLAKKVTKKSDRSIKKWPKSDRKSPENKKSDRTPFADLLLWHPDKWAEPKKKKVKQSKMK